MGTPERFAGMTGSRPRAGAGRWMVYQRERFPVVAHGALIAAFSAGAVCLSAQLRAAHAGIRVAVAPASLGGAFVCCLLFFLQLRVADEFKDAADDARWRPYRPVPRGLVTLRELAWVAVTAGAVQIVVAVALSPRLVWPCPNEKSGRLLPTLRQTRK